ncbi:type II toxin-antitoxin system prevent-host-death family antitoxin [Sphingomonas sp. SUN039]|uniref:type II toxin-antitoxin system prevent-host-death family antitoxin n=1 Tax=Sphingomonas sp. SUN039 TaxID=2937787 RepID=UPI002164E2F5|nr:type II toxin-antitoxin system prevent-host-death family antitoxin [Sphingomonas sp. SUN039]UVO53514.1 type II toxin-antitoxin system prevent-host-death family antitoxin [Sphingomonas sp. SUN039]
MSTVRPVDAAEGGGSVAINPQGNKATQFASVEKRRAVDIDSLRALTSAMPRQKESAQAFVRAMRDGDRY